MSLAALPPDPALPELSAAGDAELMRDVFARHLRPLREGALQLDGCRVSRIHYHRGDRCALRYTLRLRDPDAGTARSQWVTGLLYAGDRATRVWEKLRRAHPAGELSEALGLFEPVSFLTDLKLIVQVFPYDRHLPGLPRLMLSPPPELEPVFRAAFGVGDRRTPACRVTPSQYRVGRAAVLRYEVDADAGSGEPTTKRFFAKLYRREEQGARAHRVLRGLVQEPAGFGVPTPVAYLRELATLVQDAVPGTTLRELLAQGTHERPARRTAAALTAFRRGGCGGLPRHRAADEVEILRAACRVLGWACPDLHARVERVVDAVSARLEDVPPERTHGELKTAHVFLDGDALAVVDLDSAAAADPLLDPGRLLAELTGLRLRVETSDEGRWTAAAAMFAEEYLRHAPATWRARLVPHYAGALLKEAVDFFRHLEPGWPEKVPALVAEAEAALSRREW